MRTEPLKTKKVKMDLGAAKEKLQNLSIVFLDLLHADIRGEKGKVREYENRIQGQIEELRETLGTIELTRVAGFKSGSGAISYRKETCEWHWDHDAPSAAITARAEVDISASPWVVTRDAVWVKIFTGNASPDETKKDSNESPNREGVIDEKANKEYFGNLGFLEN